MSKSTFDFFSCFKCAADTDCSTSTNTNYDATKPICGTSTTAGKSNPTVALGVCGGCTKDLAADTASTCSTADSKQTAADCAQGNCATGQICCKDFKCVASAGGTNLGSMCT